MTADERRERAGAIINCLRDDFHYTVGLIAKRTGDFGYEKSGKKGVSQGTISRLAKPDNKWHASELLLIALENVQKDAVERNLGISLTLLPIRVLDYCGEPVDKKNHARLLEDAVKSALRSMPASPLVKLPDGIEGVLVSLGDDDSGIYMFLIDGNLDASKKKVVAHELEHIAARLRDASDPSPDDHSSADV